MARIRTIKPEFFRHEELQDLGAEAMLVFAGLWTQCDNHGRFLWRPRQLKLDILPFMKFDMETVLEKLRKAGFVMKYEVGGKWYGCVPTFRDHQRISGKELTDGDKYPEPLEGSNGEALEKQGGSNGDQQESQEREREREKERERIYGSDFLKISQAYPKKTGSKKAAFAEWKKLNGTKPSPEIVLEAINKQIEWRNKAGPDDFRPEWKDLERWIKNRMWEIEIEPPKQKSVFS